MSRILVGLSGGVDSAVAAYLLIQQGHDVAAGFMKNYTTDAPGCTTREDRDMAIKVAEHLGIKTFVITDFRSEYQQQIIDYIIHTYQQGLTPNPDVFCNNLIKFGLFLDQAKKLGCDGIATGHYAQIQKKRRNEESGRNKKGNTKKTQEGSQTSSDLPYSHFFGLYQGVDPIKDQSYFLSRLSQDQLAHAYFPLGGMMKSEVREIAQQIGLPNATRADSQGLCFIGDIPMRDFLQQYLPIKPGPIVDLQGNTLGKHQGAYFYTIGQRHGLGLNQQVYVIKIDVTQNTVIVGPKNSQSLLEDHCLIQDLHWIHPDYHIDQLPSDIQVKIRYRQSLQGARLTKSDHQTIRVEFDQAQRAVAPGQICVIYRQGEVLGSGVIV